MIPESAGTPGLAAQHQANTAVSSNKISACGEGYMSRDDISKQKHDSTVGTLILTCLRLPLLGCNHFMKTARELDKF